MTTFWARFRDRFLGRRRRLSRADVACQSGFVIPRRADFVAMWPRDDAGDVKCAVCAGHVRGQLELMLPTTRFRINSLLFR